MFRSFSRSLANRLGIIILVIEIVILSIMGFIYYTTFANQIDARQIDKLRVAGKVIIEGGLNLKTLVDYDKMSLIVGDQIADAMLIDPTNTILFSLNPDYRRKALTEVPFLNAQDLSWNATEMNFHRLTWENLPYLASDVAFATGPGGAQRYVLYLRVGVSQAEREKQSIALLLLVGFSIMIAATSVAIFLFFNQALLVRIADLAHVTRKVEMGDFSVRSLKQTRLGSSEDELGILQAGINSMIDRLQNSIETLEQRVLDRTRDLTISAEVSRHIATILNREMLITELVQRTATAFDFYQVSIFEYNAAQNSLSLIAASGETGRQMIEDDKFFDLNATGLVPTAARTLQPIVINDVSTSADFAPNPLLQKTQSETALPILFGGSLLGILDLQSERRNRFSEGDVNLFAAFANQIAVAFRNSSLFEEAERARQRAEQADSAKSAFLASTSHELRTPLNAIINLTSFVCRGMMGPTTPRQVEVLTLVMQSGQNLLSLINDVLDMSKIESGSLKLYIEEDIDIMPIVETVCVTARSLLDGKPVTLSTELEAPLPLVSVDKHRFQQILLNILSNACKFTEEGEIHLAISHEDDNLLISVKDSGVGIAEKDMDKVFEKFAQSESGLRHGGGTGLGMPITKNLVEAHDGKIRLESEPGKGTVFFVTIPVKQSSAISTLQSGVKTL